MSGGEGRGVVTGAMTTKFKRSVKDFCEIARELEMPILRIYVLIHLFKSLFLR